MKIIVLVTPNALKYISLMLSHSNTYPHSSAPLPRFYPYVLGPLSFLPSIIIICVDRRLLGDRDNRV